MKNNNTLKTLLAAPLLALSLSFGLQAEAIAQTTKPASEPFMYVEQMPEFKGGMDGMIQFLGSNIKYPEAAKTKGVEGLVVASFVVETDGNVSDVKIVKPLGHGTDEETMRVVKLMSGQWTPGTQKGQAVRVRYTLPVKFALTDSDRAATANVANRMPQFKGGTEAMQQAMQTHLALPAEAKKENLNARVMVKFYVDKTGQVSNVRLDGTKLKKTVGPGSELDYMDASTFQLQNKAVLAKLSESAMAAVKATSGQWEPALKSGQPAGAEVVLPVQFLSSESGKGTEHMGVPSMTKYTKEAYKYEEADVKPTLKDGSLEKFMAKNLRYPKESTFEGTYKIGLRIKADGTVSGPWYTPMKDVEISQMTILNKEIERVIKLMDGKWIPGKVDGQPVTISKDITILFVTDGGAYKPTEQEKKSADVIVTRYK